MIIVVANSKGGVGKSTVAVHLAAWLHEQGHRVTLADCDSQQSSSEWIREALPDVAVVRLINADEVLEQLPLLAHGNGHSSLDAEAVALADAADVDDFEPEDESAPPVITAADLAQPQPPLNVEDAKIAAEESIITAAEPDLSAMAPPFEPPLTPPAAPPAPAFEPPLAVPVPAWDPPVLSQPSRATQSCSR